MSLPRVPAYVIGYSCLKGCVYGLFFWLPTFLDSKGPLIGDQKGFISSMIDYGSIIGAITLGLAADKWNKRALFLNPLLLLSAFLMFLVSFVLEHPWQYYLAMLLIGISIIGPYNMIGTVITMDIGQNMNGKDSVAKISSLIEGMASFITAI
jgi:sugar phosphate permease